MDGQRMDMIRGITIICGLLLLSTAVNAQETGELDLRDYKWKNRVVILFAPAASHPDYMLLKRQILNHPLEWRDRDLVGIDVLHIGTSRLENREISSYDANALRKQFVVPPGAFAVILIGKDGTVKLDRRERITLDDLFDRIDVMPMRRQEMKRQKKTIDHRG